MAGAAVAALIVPLSTRLTDLDRQFDALPMREPTVADIRDWPVAMARTIDDFIVLAARLAVVEGATVAPETLRRLPPRDAYRIVEALSPFFSEPATSTGGTSPASAPGATDGRPTSSAASD